MLGFNYPIRVLKKKMQSDDYKPFAVDCTSGQTLELHDSRMEVFAYRAFQSILFGIALGILYFVVISPILETSRARDNVDQSLSSLGDKDASTINTLRTSQTVVSETIENGLVTLVISTDRSKLQQTLELAFSLASVREVYTDGRTIAVTFVSSAP